MSGLLEAMLAWRHHLHAHPEFGFEETATAAFVAARLRDFGLEEVVEGVGGTGVVGTLSRGRGGRAIALRAEMDALRITEQATPPYRSTRPGLMHACGHDGHAAMLLGAARLLAEEGGFEGTVRLVFQPAEEWGRGAAAMLADGLLARFPFEEIYGLHNMPGIDLGVVTTRPGPIMSAEDNFEIVLEGSGGHASRPDLGREVMVAGASLVLALQSIVARVLDPAVAAVVSVTEFITDGTRNVLPGRVIIRGDVRSFSPDVSRAIEAAMGRIAAGVAGTYGASATLTYSREFVPLVNDAACAGAVLEVAARLFGPDRAVEAAQPATASEDFARFLAHVPGCFAFLGSGAECPPLHNPRYDFPDALLADGARLLAAIARQRLVCGPGTGG